MQTLRWGILVVVLQAACAGKAPAPVATTHEPADGTTVSARDARTGAAVDVPAGVDMPREEEITVSNLKVIVRSAAYVEGRREVMPDLIAKPLAGDLWVVYVVDFPAMTRPLRAADLAKLKLSEADALATALTNTKAQVGDLAALVTMPLPTNGMGYMAPEGYFNSGLLASPQDWAPLAAKAKGTFLVSVPSDELVLYVDSANPGGAGVLHALTAKAYADAGRPVSQQILAWSADGWKPHK